MSKRVALITGINGQDGSYLAELLLEKDYEVHGIVRRNSVPENQDARIDGIDGIVTHYGDLLDVCSLQKILRLVNPDEVYNLASQSHVRISFDVPQFTVQANALGVLNILETCRELCPNVRFYQASSSEMFGNSYEQDYSQNEHTRMNPVSPYGCAKVFGYNIARHYRRAYRMFVVNGILFNHESPRRASNFVTSKVVKGAVEIRLGLKKTLELGNMDSKRDWGHSCDYVRAMWMMMQHSIPDDFVVATGVTHSVREMCDYVFDRLGLKYDCFVSQNLDFMRPEELHMLRGDSHKIRHCLGWKPGYTFETMMNEIIDFWRMHYAGINR